MFVRLCLSILWFQLCFGFLTENKNLSNPEKGLNDLRNYLEIVKLEVNRVFDEKLNNLQRALEYSSKHQNKRSLTNGRQPAFQKVDTETLPKVIQEFKNISVHAFAVENVNNEFFVVISGKLRSPTDNTYIWLWNNSKKQLQLFASIMIRGAIGLETFSINGKLYLIATLNERADFKDPFVRKTQLFEIRHNSTVVVQSFLTVASTKWKIFKFSNSLYLLQASYLKFKDKKRLNRKCSQERLKASKTVEVYQWKEFGFKKIQTISGSYVTDLEICKIQSKTFLIVANQKSANADRSSVFVYEVLTGVGGKIKFQLFQDLPAFAPRDVHCFYAENSYFLAIANEYRTVMNQRFYDTESSIFRFNGLFFSAYQQVKSIGAVKWNSFLLHDGPERPIWILHLRSRDSRSQQFIYSRKKWESASLPVLENVQNIYMITDDFYVISRPSIAVLQWKHYNHAFDHSVNNLKNNFDSLFQRLEANALKLKSFKDKVYKVDESSTLMALLPFEDKLNKSAESIAEMERNQLAEQSTFRVEELVISNLNVKRLIANNMRVRLINDVDFSQFVDEIVKVIPKSENKLLVKQNRFKDLRLEGEVTLTGTLNGFAFQSFAVLNRPNVFSAPKMIENLIVDDSLFVTGVINGYASDNFFLKFGDQEMDSDLVVEGNVQMHNLRIKSGIVDGVDWNLLTKAAIPIDKRSTDIQGNVNFTANIITDELIVNGLINGVNITDVYKTVLTFDKFKSDPKLVTFKSLEVLGDVIVEHKTVNNYVFPDQFVKLNSQIWTIPESIFKDVITDSIIVRGTVNGLDLLQDILLRDGFQTIEGRKHLTHLSFQNISTVNGNPIAKPRIYIDKLKTRNIGIYGSLYPNILKLKTAAYNIYDDVYCHTAVFESSVEVTDGHKWPPSVTSALVPIRTDDAMAVHIKSMNNVQFLNSVIVKGPIDGVYIEELLAQSVCLSRNWQTANRLIFADKVITSSLDSSLVRGNGFEFISNNSGAFLNVQKDILFKTIYSDEIFIVGSLSNVNLVHFFNDTLLSGVGQYVFGSKTIKGNLNILENNVATDNFKISDQIEIRGRNVMQLFRDAVLVDSALTFIHSELEFTQSVAVQHLLTDMVDEIKIHDLLHGSLLINESRSLIFYGNLKSNSVYASKLNNVTVDHFLLNVARFGHFSMPHHIKFEKVIVNNNLLFSGTINGIKTSELVSVKDKVVTFKNSKWFKGFVHVCQNITAKRDFIILSNSIEENYSVSQLIIEGNLLVKSYLDGILWSSFMENSIFNAENKLYGECKLHLKKIVLVNELSITGLVNNINLQDMVTVDQPCFIHGNVFFKNLTTFSKALHFKNFTKTKLNSIGIQERISTGNLRFLGPVSIRGSMASTYFPSQRFKIKNINLNILKSDGILGEVNISEWNHNSLKLNGSLIYINSLKSFDLLEISKIAICKIGEMRKLKEEMDEYFKTHCNNKDQKLIIQNVKFNNEVNIENGIFTKDGCLRTNKGKSPLATTVAVIDALPARIEATTLVHADKTRKPKYHRPQSSTLQSNLPFIFKPKYSKTTALSTLDNFSSSYPKTIFEKGTEGKSREQDISKTTIETPESSLKHTTSRNKPRLTTLIFGGNEWNTFTTNFPELKSNVFTTKIKSGLQDVNLHLSYTERDCNFGLCDIDFNNQPKDRLEPQTTTNGLLIDSTLEMSSEFEEKSFETSESESRAIHSKETLRTEAIGTFLTEKMDFISNNVEDSVTTESTDAINGITETNGEAMFTQNTAESNSSMSVQTSSDDFYATETGNETKTTMPSFLSKFGSTYFVDMDANESFVQRETVTTENSVLMESVETDGNLAITLSNEDFNLTEIDFSAIETSESNVEFQVTEIDGGITSAQDLVDYSYGQSVSTVTVDSALCSSESECAIVHDDSSATATTIFNPVTDISTATDELVSVSVMREMEDNETVLIPETTVKTRLTNGTSTSLGKIEGDNVVVSTTKKAVVTRKVSSILPLWKVSCSNKSCLLTPIIEESTSDLTLAVSKSEFTGETLLSEVTDETVGLEILDKTLTTEIASPSKASENTSSKHSTDRTLLSKYTDELLTSITTDEVSLTEESDKTVDGTETTMAIGIISTILPSIPEMTVKPFEIDQLTTIEITETNSQPEDKVSSETTIKSLPTEASQFIFQSKIMETMTESSSSGKSEISEATGEILIPETTDETSLLETTEVITEHDNSTFIELISSTVKSQEMTTDLIKTDSLSSTVEVLKSEIFSTSEQSSFSNSEALISGNTADSEVFSTETESELTRIALQTESHTLSVTIKTPTATDFDIKLATSKSPFDDQQRISDNDSVTGEMTELSSISSSSLESIFTQEIPFSQSTTLGDDITSVQHSIDYSHGPLDLSVTVDSTLDAIVHDDSSTTESTIFNPLTDTSTATEELVSVSVMHEMEDNQTVLIPETTVKALPTNGTSTTRGKIEGDKVVVSVTNKSVLITSLSPLCSNKSCLLTTIIDEWTSNIMTESIGETLSSEVTDGTGRTEILGKTLTTDLASPLQTSDSTSPEYLTDKASLLEDTAETLVMSDATGEALTSITTDKVLLTETTDNILDSIETTMLFGITSTILPSSAADMTLATKITVEPSEIDDLTLATEITESVSQPEDKVLPEITIKSLTTDAPEFTFQTKSLETITESSSSDKSGISEVTASTLLSETTDKTLPARENYEIFISDTTDETLISEITEVVSEHDSSTFTELISSTVRFQEMTIDVKSDRLSSTVEDLKSEVLSTSEKPSFLSTEISISKDVTGSELFTTNFETKSAMFGVQTEPITDAEIIKALTSTTEADSMFSISEQTLSTSSWNFDSEFSTSKSSFEVQQATSDDDSFTNEITELSSISSSSLESIITHEIPVSQPTTLGDDITSVQHSINYLTVDSALCDSESDCAIVHDASSTTATTNFNPLTDTSTATVSIMQDIEDIKTVLVPETTGKSRLTNRTSTTLGKIEGDNVAAATTNKSVLITSISPLWNDSCSNKSCLLTTLIDESTTDLTLAVSMSEISETLSSEVTDETELSVLLDKTLTTDAILLSETTEITSLKHSTDKAMSWEDTDETSIAPDATDEVLTTGGFLFTKDTETTSDHTEATLKLESISTILSSKAIDKTLATEMTEPVSQQEDKRTFAPLEVSVYTWPSITSKSTEVSETEAMTETGFTATDEMSEITVVTLLSEATDKRFPSGRNIDILRPETTDETLITEATVITTPSETTSNTPEFHLTDRPYAVTENDFLLEVTETVTKSQAKSTIPQETTIEHLSSVATMKSSADSTETTYNADLETEKSDKSSDITVTFHSDSGTTSLHFEESDVLAETTATHFFEVTEQSISDIARTAFTDTTLLKELSETTEISSPTMDNDKTASEVTLSTDYLTTDVSSSEAMIFETEDIADESLDKTSSETNFLTYSTDDFENTFENILATELSQTESDIFTISEALSEKTETVIDMDSTTDQSSSTSTFSIFDEGTNETVAEFFLSTVISVKANVTNTTRGDIVGEKAVGTTTKSPSFSFSSSSSIPKLCKNESCKIIPSAERSPETTSEESLSYETSSLEFSDTESTDFSTFTRITGKDIHSLIESVTSFESSILEDHTAIQDQTSDTGRLFQSTTLTSDSSDEFMSDFTSESTSSTDSVFKDQLTDEVTSSSSSLLSDTDLTKFEISSVGPEDFTQTPHLSSTIKPLETPAEMLTTVNIVASEFPTVELTEAATEDIWSIDNRGTGTDEDSTIHSTDDLSLSSLEDITETFSTTVISPKKSTFQEFFETQTESSTILPLNESLFFTSGTQGTKRDYDLSTKPASSFSESLPTGSAMKTAHATESEEVSDLPTVLSLSSESFITSYSTVETQSYFSTLKGEITDMTLETATVTVPEDASDSTSETLYDFHKLKVEITDTTLDAATATELEEASELTTVLSLSSDSTADASADFSTLKDGTKLSSILAPESTIETDSFTTELTNVASDITTLTDEISSVSIIMTEINNLKTANISEPSTKSPYVNGTSTTQGAIDGQKVVVHTSKMPVLNDSTIPSWNETCFNKSCISTPILEESKTEVSTTETVSSTSLEVSILNTDITFEQFDVSTTDLKGSGITLIDSTDVSVVDSQSPIFSMTSEISKELTDSLSSITESLVSSSIINDYKTSTLEKSAPETGIADKSKTETDETESSSIADIYFTTPTELIKSELIQDLETSTPSEYSASYSSGAEDFVSASSWTDISDDETYFSDATDKIIVNFTADSTVKPIDFTEPTSDTSIASTFVSSESTKSSNIKLEMKKSSESSLVDESIVEVTTPTDALIESFTLMPTQLSSISTEAQTKVSDEYLIQSTSEMVSSITGMLTQIVEKLTRTVLPTSSTDSTEDNLHAESSLDDVTSETVIVSPTAETTVNQPMTHTEGDQIVTDIDITDDEFEKIPSSTSISTESSSDMLAMDLMTIAYSYLDALASRISPATDFVTLMTEVTKKPIASGQLIGQSSIEGNESTSHQKIDLTAEDASRSTTGSDESFELTTQTREDFTYEVSTQTIPTIVVTDSDRLETVTLELESRLPNTTLASVSSNETSTFSGKIDGDRAIGGSTTNKTIITTKSHEAFAQTEIWEESTKNFDSDDSTVDLQTQTAQHELSTTQTDLDDFGLISIAIGDSNTPTELATTEYSGKASEQTLEYAVESTLESLLTELYGYALLSTEDDDTSSSLAAEVAMTSTIVDDVSNITARSNDLMSTETLSTNIYLNETMKTTIVDRVVSQKIKKDALNDTECISTVEPTVNNLLADEEVEDDHFSTIITTEDEEPVTEAAEEFSTLWSTTEEE